MFLKIITITKWENTFIVKDNGIEIYIRVRKNVNDVELQILKFFRIFHNMDESHLGYGNGREDFLLRSRKILDVLFWKGSFCAPPNSIGHRLKIHETWIFLLLVFLVDIKIMGMTSYFLETLSLDFCKMLRSTSHTKISFLI